MELPDWAEAPGPGWTPRSASNLDVVWEKGRQVSVQLRPEAEAEPVQARRLPRWVPPAAAGVAGILATELARHLF